ncbi:hypothetical protein SBBP1_380003 [Burkholderiales bacterium]|nr:hypothetical protein SBBP1_380003 [Burkholderiales bacterium]
MDSFAFHARGAWSKRPAVPESDGSSAVSSMSAIAVAVPGSDAAGWRAAFVLEILTDECDRVASNSGMQPLFASKHCPHWGS